MTMPDENGIPLPEDAVPPEPDTAPGSVDAAGRADDAPTGPPPTAYAKPPPPGQVFALSVIALFVLAMGFGIWGLWRAFTPAPADAVLQLAQQQQRIGELEQRITDLARSDEISRVANAQVQATLAERDEEIAALRADVAFYERFVGPTAQRRGLSVHALELKAQDAQTWHFVATLTQNISQGAVSAGQLRLALEGSQDGRMRQLDWATLRQQPNPQGVPYSFKFFQRVEGDVLLPQGFHPVRVIVRLAPAGGRPLEQSFTWAEATGTAPADAANGNAGEAP